MPFNPGRITSEIIFYWPAVFFFKLACQNKLKSNVPKSGFKHKKFPFYLLFPHIVIQIQLVTRITNTILEYCFSYLL